MSLRCAAVGIALAVALEGLVAGDAMGADRCRPRAATETSVGSPSARAAWRAQPLGALAPRARPAGGERLGRLTGAPPWLLVLGEARARRGGCWVRLRLPRRPNDAAGWVPRRAVALAPTPFRIVVSRARRTLTLLHAGAPVMRARVVIGTPSTPTPGGLFAITGAWPNPPHDFSGSWILTLTAHSRALRRFDGGDGRVAIHGRGAASLADPLGAARSHGCVRVANGDLDKLMRIVGRARLAGTPVRIR